MGNRKRRGPRSVFGPKERPARTHLMTPLGKRILDAYARASGRSESDVSDAVTRLAPRDAVLAVLTADLE